MSMRKRRFCIQRNEKNEQPSQIITVSTCTRTDDSCNWNEDNGSCITIRSGMAIAVHRKGNKWYKPITFSFPSGKLFWEFCRSRTGKRQPVWVIAYNWQLQSQLLQLFREYDEGRFTSFLPAREFVDADGDIKTIPEWRGMLAIDDKPFICYAVSPQGTVKIIDIRNYLDIPLASLADSVGRTLPRTDTQEESDELASQRMQTECEVLLLTMQRLMDSWNQGQRGNWQPTAARLAYSNYRHEFMAPYNIVIDNERMDRDYQRSGYFGGESQCWYRGYQSGPIYKVDVSGMYPYVMSLYSFPTDIDVIIKPDVDSGVPEPEFPANCMATVHVYSDGDLPMRCTDGKLSYPYGNIITVLCGEELEWARVNGRIIQWIGYTQFKMNPIFQRYVAYWWNIRKQADWMQDKATSELAKLMLNSLYGKFASRRPQWTIDTTLVAPLRWGYFLAPSVESGKLEKYRVVSGIVQRFTGQEERLDTFPAISAFVASAGRAYMKEVRKILPANSILAQQTDGLLLTEEGFDVISKSDYWRPGQLGKFRLADIFWWVEMYDANHYLHSEGICIAGLPEIHKRIEHNQFTYKSYSSNQENIATGNRRNVTVQNRDYTLVACQRERMYAPDGWAFR